VTRAPREVQRRSPLAILPIHPAVRRELGRFVLFKVDVTDDTPRDRRLQEKYGRNLPLMVLLDAQGRERARAGKIGTSEMLALLRKVR